MRNIENILSNKRTKYNVDGTKSDETKRVGFCTNTIHKGYLTKRLMDEHQCLEKNCKCFIKYEKNTYWQQKQAQKEKRQQHKEEKKFWEQKKEYALYLMRDLTKDFENVGITTVSKVENHLEIKYVSLDKINLSSELEKVKMLTGVKCTLVSIKNTNKVKRELLEMFNPQVKGYLNDNIINK